jgi:hypothetical protein
MNQGSDAKLSVCKQCEAVVSSEAQECPSCKTKWLHTNFYCYCCGEALKKSEAAKIFTRDKYHETLGDFSYHLKFDSAVEDDSTSYSCTESIPDKQTVRLHCTREYDYLKLNNGKHYLNSNQELVRQFKDTIDSPGYYRLYHQACHSQILSYSRIDRRYDHTFSCSLCGEMNNFLNHSHNVLTPCKKCGHPNRSTQPQRNYDINCMQCGFVIEESSKSTIQLPHLGPGVMVHSSCYPNHLKGERDELWRQKKALIEKDEFDLHQKQELEKTEIKKHRREQEIKREAKARELQRKENHADFMRYVAMAPYVVGILVTISYPMPFGIILGIIAFFVSIIIVGALI